MFRVEIHFFFFTPKNIPNEAIISISFFFSHQQLRAQTYQVTRNDLTSPAPADHVTTGHQHPNPLWIKLQHHVQLQRSNHLSMFIPGGSTNANKDQRFQSVNVGCMYSTEVK